MDAGFGNEDDYNKYTKPLFDRYGLPKNIYKPTDSGGTGDSDQEYQTLKTHGTTQKFQPSKGFAGAEGGGTTRSAPVQFERGK